jgi:hypothetical protein
VIIDDIRAIKSGKKELRNFGIIVGIGFAVIGGLFLWRDKSIYLYFFCISFPLLLLGFVAPKILKPVQKAWMTLAIVLGWIVTNIILFILFFLGVTIIGLLAKLFRKKFLDLKFNMDVESYWIPKEEKKVDKSDYEKQF